MDNEFDTWQEAVWNSINKSGKKLKQVANELWPAKNICTASADLTEIINKPTRRKFSPDEIAQFCKITKQYDVIYYLCDQAGLERPKPKTSDKIAEEGYKLLREVQKSQDKQQQLIEKAMQMFGNALDKPADNVLTYNKKQGGGE